MALAGELHPLAKLTEQAAHDIVWRYGQGGNTYESLALEYGIALGTVSALLRGHTWRHVTGGEAVQAPIRPLATHCQHDHEFTPETTIWVVREDRPRPTRLCRTCHNKRQAASKRRKRGNFR